jgi:hypothetical protein
MKILIDTYKYQFIISCFSEYSLKQGIFLWDFREIFKKNLQLIFNKDADFGFNLEHTGADAGAWTELQTGGYKFTIRSTPGFYRILRDNHVTFLKQIKEPPNNKGAAQEI